MDTLRLCDLLITLLFEGRQALPKISLNFMSDSSYMVSPYKMMIGREGGDLSHRQLIDCIRSKETDALIDAVDSGG